MIDETLIRNTIQGYLDGIIFESTPETNREELIEQLDEACDEAWGELVQIGRIDAYAIDDLVGSVSECAAIIKFADANAWVEDDHGLWDGLVYGVVASVAYFSLRNCFYALLEASGIDSNVDLPFGADESVVGIPKKVVKP